MNKRIKISILVALLLILIISGILLLKNRKKGEEEPSNVTQVPQPTVEASRPPENKDSQITDLPVEPEKVSISLPDGKCKENIYRILPATESLTDLMYLYQGDLYHYPQNEELKVEIKQLDSGNVYLPNIFPVTYEVGLKCRSYYIGQSGSIWVICEEEEGYCILEFQPGDFNVQRKISLPGLTEWIEQDKDVNLSSQVRKMQVDSDFIYLQYQNLKNNYLIILDFEGKLIQVFEDCIDFSIDEKGTVYLCAGTKIKKITAIDEVEQWERTEKNVFKLYYSPEHDKLFTLNKNSIRVYDSKGVAEPVEWLRIGIDTSFLLDDTEKIVSVFLVDPKFNVYLGIKTRKVISEDPWRYEDTLTLYQYYFEEEQPVEYTYTITAPYKDPFLINAIEAYENQNSDIHIYYDYSYETEEEYLEHQAEYGQNLSLRVMTGDIGDIVMGEVWNFDYNTLGRTDAFLELNDRIEGLDCYSDLNHAVLEGMKINQKIYALPISVLYDCILVDEDLAKQTGIDINAMTWGDAIDLALQWMESGRQERVLDDSGSAVYEFLWSNLPQLVDYETKSYNLRQDWFFNTLEQCKSLNDAGYFSGNDSSVYLDGHTLIKCRNKFRYRSARSYAQEGVWLQKSSENSAQKFYSSLSGQKAGNQRAYPGQVFLISKRSKHQEEAWDFLSYLLLPEIQKNKDLIGVALNLKAEKELFENEYKMYSGDVNEEEWKMYQEVFETVDFSYQIPNFESDVITVLADWIHGKTDGTLEQMIERVEQNLDLRMNE